MPTTRGTEKKKVYINFVALFYPVYFNFFRIFHSFIIIFFFQPLLTPSLFHVSRKQPVCEEQKMLHSCDLVANHRPPLPAYTPPLYRRSALHQLTRLMAKSTAGRCLRGCWLSTETAGLILKY
uniref:Uncharacterized protein n=1 Tax=Rhipicephalus zambeziensis TaxID=60191 RepID=A0A224YK48_9ACAR